MFQRILVPLDGSLRAERAIPVAARIASASHGSILLVRVIDVLLDFSWQMAGVSPDLTGALEVARANANAYLEEMAEVDALRGLNVTTQAIEGRPADALLSVAQDMQADLIVMSSHGHTGLKRWVLGSVAQVIERRSSIPVLILRDQLTFPHNFRLNREKKRSIERMSSRTTLKRLLSTFFSETVKRV